MAETENREREILYDSGEYSLLRREERLFFLDGGTQYAVFCHGYEPCLYLYRDDDCEPIAIHNFLMTADLIRTHETGTPFVMITGNSHGLAEICRLLHIAVNNGGSSLDISYLEGLLVLEKLEKEGACSEETAADIAGYGIENVRIMHSFEHSGKVRKTADGKFYLTAKGRKKKK